MADTPTLQSLSDLISIEHQDIIDIKLQLSDFDTRISTNTSSITALQNPPAAVPPGLLSWLAIPHTLTEVDTALNTTITGHTTSIGTLTTNVSDLTTDLSTETTSRIDADTALQANIDSANDDITNLTTALTQEISDRATLAASVASSLTTANARIDGVNTDLSNEISTRAGLTTTLQQQVATLNQAVQTVNTQITLLQNIGVDPLAAQASQITTLTTLANDASTATANETTARIAADTALQNSITANGTAISSIQTNLTAETGARQSADAAINASLGTLQTTVSGHTASISAETAARISADSTLTANVATNTTNIADNAANIAQEIIDRGAADTNLQTQITTNTGNITTNTTNITSLTTTQNLIKTKFGVVKDGGGYVTSWRVLDDSAAAGNFNLRNLNNDARLQNPGYIGKYCAPVAVASFAPATSYDTAYGTGPSTLFHGTDGNDYARNVNVYSTLSAGINGSVFRGVDHGSGGDTQRLGQVLTTFLVNFSGYVNGQLSLWYRIKTNPADTTQRWFAVSQALISMPSPRTYELASGRAVVQISVTASQVVEFGLTNLSTLDATRSASNTFIYNGAVSVEAFNMVTVS
jgi:hypothetical protein